MFESKTRVLCVEDDPGVLKFLETVLTSNGYEVVKAENGEEALEKIREKSIDLVISDVIMPKVDGFELCRRIKEDEKHRNISVVIITGLSSKEDRIKGIEAGAEDFITKPLDPREILARMKMLLKAKKLHERRIGELFVEMGFITEQQLQRALVIAKEQNIKVGEALYSMGALDKDHIYWVLANQLNMNYVELSPEMINRELIKQFSEDTLKELFCLPLYETADEIHFAIADPTDQNIVRKVKGLRPGKSVELHLALPEKIMDDLNIYKEDFLLQPQAPKIGSPMTKKVESKETTRSKVWNDLVTVLLSMPQNEFYWLYKTPLEWCLFSETGNQFKTIRTYPQENDLLMEKRFRQNPTFQAEGGETMLLLQEKTTRRLGAFKLKQLDCLDREMIRIGRIPTFSEEEFTLLHPQATSLIKKFECALSEHKRLLIGGKDCLFIKKCCYCLIKKNKELSYFPPPLFIETQIETYFPKVAQLSRNQCNILASLQSFKGMEIPFLLCEAETAPTSGEKYLSHIFFNCKNLVLCFPFSSFEEMESAFSATEDWHQAGFKNIFLSPYEIKSF